MVRENNTKPKPDWFSGSFTTSNKNKLLQCSTAPSLNNTIKEIIDKPKTGRIFFKREGLVAGPAFMGSVILV